MTVNMNGIQKARRFAIQILSLEVHMDFRDTGIERISVFQLNIIIAPGDQISLLWV